MKIENGFFELDKKLSDFLVKDGCLSVPFLEGIPKKRSCYLHRQGV